MVMHREDGLHQELEQLSLCRAGLGQMAPETCWAQALQVCATELLQPPQGGLALGEVPCSWH